MDMDSKYLRAQAEKCRWLAERSADHVRETLAAMAAEYDEKAVELERLHQPMPRAG